MGRPSVYSKAMLPKILALMKSGASKVEVAVELGISRDTFYRWEKEHVEFSDTIKEGAWISQAWWEKQGRENLMNKGFNNTLWYMNMKNRFGWTDSPRPDDEIAKLEWEKSRDKLEEVLRGIMDVTDDEAYPDFVPVSSSAQS
jgi:hypothetical protein